MLLYTKKLKRGEVERNTIRIAILGTVGIPATYGGFETLAENLAKFSQANRLPVKLIVYCSTKNYSTHPKELYGAELRYKRLNANGVSSIFYDAISLFSAVRRRSDVILLLGVSGAIALPLVRLLSRARIVTNIDGIEWKREKWSGLARCFLRFSEWLAVRFSHVTLVDNEGVARHVSESYRCYSQLIAYGGDHAVSTPLKPYTGIQQLPSSYALALCRIEPENNVAMILEAFAQMPETPLVFIGNWNNSPFGRKLRLSYDAIPHLYLLDPIYDIGELRSIRSNAMVYIHGHSAGGTNPSLVEMMHFDLPILAYDCIYNRSTTNDQALYFTSSDDLIAQISSVNIIAASQVGKAMGQLARERYMWETVATAYFDLLIGDEQMSENYT